MKKVTGISFVRNAEGLHVAYTYSEMDDQGNVLDRNKKGSYINMDDDVESFVEILETSIRERIG